MAFLFRQTKQNSGTTSALVISPTSSTIVNNLVIVNIKLTSLTATVTSVTDNQGNIYTKALGPITNALLVTSSYQFYGVQAVGGVTSITINISASVSVRADIDEFSGNHPTQGSVFDKAASNTDG